MHEHAVSVEPAGKKCTEEIASLSQQRHGPARSRIAEVHKHLHYLSLAALALHLQVRVDFRKILPGTLQVGSNHMSVIYELGRKLR